MKNAKQNPELNEEAYNLLLLHGNASEAARASGIPRKTLTNRAERFGVNVKLPTEWTYPEYIDLDMRGKTLLVGGDAHFWPGHRSLIWEAFVEASHEIKPDAIILNGDMIDGTRVSKHPRLRNQAAPRVSDELKECKYQINRLYGSEVRIWNLGNHDQRVDSYLANNAPEADDLASSLPSWFPEWQFGYSVMINRGLPNAIPCEVRHYYRTGVHARHNNIMYSGIHMVTNHTHGAGVTPFNNRMGRIYGIETGMLNSNHATQFEYGFGAQSRANGGFAVLTFEENGNLLPPELCEHVYGKAWFRGRAWGEKPRYRVKSA